MDNYRLLKLATLLEADAEKADGIMFDLNRLVTAPPGTVGAVNLNCGTQACAMGLAIISGAFEADGVSYRVEDGHFDALFDGEYCDWEGLATRLFDIDDAMIGFLFLSGSYPDRDKKGAESEREVAQRIRDVVAGKVVAPKLEDEDWETEGDM